MKGQLQQPEIEEKEEESLSRGNGNGNIINTSYDVYKNIEGAMQLAKLEDPQMLLVAVRHIIRNNHEKGSTISFPQIEAVDRIHLKSNNLPTEPKEILNLVKKVFARRQEILNLDQIYEQFVRAHGRTIVDFKQPWPACNVHTHQP